MPVTRSDPGRRRPPGERRAALLELLREHAGPLSVAELAERLGLHPNSVRAHLDVLVRTGRVTRRTEQRATPGRPRDVYEATGAPDGDRNYQLLAQVLATRLAEVSPDPAAAAAEAGRRWAERTDDVGPRPAAAPRGPTSAASPPAASPPATSSPGASPVEAALEPVVRMLRAGGFAPQVVTDAPGAGSRIDLHHCPFLEVAREHPDVVCGAHLGLVEGELERAGTLARATLVPFARPGVCVVDLGPA